MDQKLFDRHGAEMRVNGDGSRDDHSQGSYEPDPFGDAVPYKGSHGRRPNNRHVKRYAVVITNASNPSSALDHSCGCLCCCAGQVKRRTRLDHGSMMAAVPTPVQNALFSTRKQNLFGSRTSAPMVILRRWSCSSRRPQCRFRQSFAPKRAVRQCRRFAPPLRNARRSSRRASIWAVWSVCANPKVERSCSFAGPRSRAAVNRPTRFAVNVSATTCEQSAKTQR